MDIDRIIQEVTGEVYQQQKIAQDSYIPMDCGFPMLDIIPKMEHSLLNADITRVKILEECARARKYGVGAVCVSPYYTVDAAKALQGCDVAVCSAVGFPQAAMSFKAKVADIKDCLFAGATEIDFAINILAVKSGDYDVVRREISEIVEMTRYKALAKAVFDQGAYNDTEKREVLSIAAECGVDMVKIQNVFVKKAACVEDVAYVRKMIGPKIGIKIDGGVKTKELARDLIAAGATRVGLTATIDIAEDILRTK